MIINVMPDHEIATEAYSSVKAMSCKHIHIIAKTYQKSETELGYFIAGIYPSNNEDGFDREQWLKEYEQLNPQI